jgi:hypothetical protein
MAPNCVDETRQIFVAGLRKYVHAIFAVANPPGYSILLRETIDERPKSDPLHDACDANADGA